MAPKPWPRYTGSLRSPLRFDASIADQIDQRLSNICDRLGIKRDSAGWERRLLVALLVRHVPGFQTRRSRSPNNLDIELIEFIDGYKDDYRQTKGRRLTTAQAIKNIVKDPDPDNPWRGKKPGRLQRIYSGRREIIEKLDHDLSKAAEDLKNITAARDAIESKEKHSHAKIVWDTILARSQL